VSPFRGLPRFRRSGGGTADGDLEGSREGAEKDISDLPESLYVDTEVLLRLDALMGVASGSDSRFGASMCPSYSKKLCHDWEAKKYDDIPLGVLISVSSSYWAIPRGGSCK
jgi:hypothetical protein